jgi:hypothetical protein
MNKSNLTIRQKYMIFVLVIVLALGAAFLYTRLRPLPVTGGVSIERAAPANLSARPSGPNPVYEYNMSRPPAFSNNNKIQSGPNPVYEYNLTRPPASPHIDPSQQGPGN